VIPSKSTPNAAEALVGASASILTLVGDEEALALGLEPAVRRAAIRELVRQAPARTADHWVRLERLGT